MSTAVPAPQADPTTEPTPTPAATGGTQEPEKRFSQAELDAHIEARLKRERDASAAKIAKEKDAAEQQRLTEQGEFKALAEAAQKERDTLAAQLAQRDHLDLQRAVAAEHKLPADLATRLQGTTRDELVTDAKALAKLLATPPDAPPAGNRPGPRPQAGPDSDQQVEASLRATGRYQAL
jgi:hypothetical protein